MGKFSSQGYFTEIKSMRERITGIGLEFTLFSTPDNHSIFLRGVNRLRIPQSTINTSISTSDDALIADNYLIVLRNSATKSPKVEVYYFVRYMIEGSFGSNSSFEILPEALTLKGNINIITGMRLAKVDLFGNGLYMLFSSGNLFILYRLCIVTYQTTFMSFTGSGQDFPQVSQVKYLEEMGRITVSYRLASNRSIVTLKSDSQILGLSGLNMSTQGRPFSIVTLNTDNYRNSTYDIVSTELGDALILLLKSNRTDTNRGTVYQQRGHGRAFSKPP